MINRIRQLNHMKKILQTNGTCIMSIYVCSFLTFFKIFRTCLKNTLRKKRFLNKKLDDFIVISIRTSFPDIYYDCLLTKKPMFSIYLFLLKSSYEIYKKFNYTIVNYALKHPKDIYAKSCHNKLETHLSDADFDGDTVIHIPSLHIYIDSISFYNLYET